MPDQTLARIKKQSWLVVERYNNYVFLHNSKMTSKKNLPLIYQNMYFIMIKKNL